MDQKFGVDKKKPDLCNRAKHKSTMSNNSNLRSKVFTLANQLVKYTDLSRPQALKYAWDYMRHHADEAQLLKAERKDGTVTTRVVFTNWAKYNTVKGTGRPTPPHLRLFVDIAKREAGFPSTVSFYRDRIISLAA